MRDVQQLKETIKKYNSQLREKYHIKKLGLFGSFISGEQKKTSDLDILVEFRKPISLFEFIDLEEYLQKILALKVDLVSKKTLKPHIGRHILEEVQYI